MKLRILHRTTYAYGEPVRESFNEARLRPVSEPGQHCDHFLLKILPSARLRHYHDFYGNCVHVFEVAAPHQQLAIEAVSQVTTSGDRILPPDQTSVPLDSLRNSHRLEHCYDFLQDSHYVELSPAAWRLGIDATQGVTDAWQAARAICRHIHQTFTYAPAATGVHTHMREALELRRGVCQDFAHVMIGACRTLHLPARYVSGYLYNGPVDQLRGAQATHAWVEVFLPELGWRALDPTNDTQPDQRYIKIGTGRDYADVSPVRGTYRGTNDRKLSVEVLVAALDPVAA